MGWFKKLLTLTPTMGKDTALSLLHHSNMVLERAIELIEELRKENAALKGTVEVDSTRIDKLWQAIMRLGCMPCCGFEILYQEGPTAGLCRNIRCAHCGAEWNMTPFGIERIGVTKFIPQTQEATDERTRTSESISAR